MIESIRADSRIQEDPGYLLIAMQCCVMKTVHLFLRGKSEERSISQGFTQRLQLLQTIHRELPAPSCKSPMALH